MKIYLIIGNRTVCSQSLPRTGLLTVDPKLATCRNCIRTRMFRRLAQPRKTARTKNQMIQQEFFQ